MPLILPPMPEYEPSWATFQAWWQEVKDAIENNEAAQQLLFDTINDVLGEGSSGVVGRVALLASYTIPTMVITATDVGANVTIAIAPHIRRYGNGNEISVAGANFTGKSYSTKYAIYYDDETMQDTSPSYQITTDLETAQYNYEGGRHYVGTVTTPAAAGPASTAGAPPAGSGYTGGASSAAIT